MTNDFLPGQGQLVNQHLNDIETFLCILEDDVKCTGQHIFRKFELDDKKDIILQVVISDPEKKLKIFKYEKIFPRTRKRWAHICENLGYTATKHVLDELVEKIMAIPVIPQELRYAIFSAQQAPAAPAPQMFAHPDNVTTAH